MSIRRLAGSETGPPAFAIPPPDIKPGSEAGEPPHIFDLSSHRRARDALAFGLAVPQLGFNIFVIGEDRSGRMTATLDHLAEHAKKLPPPPDWVYLPNFRHPERPLPFRLPAGIGRGFRDRVAALLPALREALGRAFEAVEFAGRFQRESEALQHQVGMEFAALRGYGAERGLTVERTPQGISVQPLPGYEPDALAQLPAEEQQKRAAGFAELRARLNAFMQATRQSEQGFAESVREARRLAADAALAPLMDPIAAEFGGYAGLRRWLVELRADLIDHLDLLVRKTRDDKGEDDKEGAAHLAAEDRYTVNLLVDHGDDPVAQVVLEPTPTYEKLFGSFEYRNEGGTPVTDYRHIRAGALHRANGGILVLRAEAIADQVPVWNFLKAALRDRCIRIEPPAQDGRPPIAGAPAPHPIPLEIKVVIVGAPRWYYTFFSADPDFATYFKVKADIDPDMPAEPRNLAVYGELVRHMARRYFPGGVTEAAVARLLGEAARWAGHRKKLSARFELIEDLVIETANFAKAARVTAIDVAEVRRALGERRQRSARMEDRSQEAIRDGMILIDTAGARIGQVNALTVRDLGDHAFGLPVRVSARVHAGRHGIVKVERATELGGPIQQKGIYIIGGYLSGRFARRLPLSFAATVTFEQSYGGVEGDSASMAELVAVLSALAEAPIRQDVAITGSVNQNGEAQPVGGIIEKIEGFYRTCAERGLTGEQGVLIPAANADLAVLAEDVAAAITAERFHVWTMTDVDDALALLTGLEPGQPRSDGSLPAESVMGRVQATLDQFDRLLTERAVTRGAEG